MEYSDPTVQCNFECALGFDELKAGEDLADRMLRMICVVVAMTISSSRAGPFPLPAVAPVPIVPPLSRIVPTTYPFAPNVRSTVSGLPGYNNLYYRAPGVSVPILTYSSDHNGDGSYAFSFTTADGKQAQESGYLKDAYIDNAGEPQGTQVVQGSYSYISPEGTPIQVTYIADENGFRPSGVHIPADGKPVNPLLGDTGKLLADSRLNRYDPYYNRNYPGRYTRPYDPRYPYNTRYNPTFNNYSPYTPPINTAINEFNRKTA